MYVIVGTARLTGAATQMRVLAREPATAWRRSRPRSADIGLVIV
jgi:hypothetical protein